MDIEQYVATLKSKHPEIFERLPVPDSLAEKWGVPKATDEVVHLNTYLKAFFAAQTTPIDCFEEKKAIEVIPASKPTDESAS